MPGVPTPTEIETFKADTLRQYAAHHTKLGNSFQDEMDAVKRDAHAITWVGNGGDGMRSDIDKIHTTASDYAQTLHEAATTAQGGATVLEGLQKTIMSKVQSATNRGFEVTPTWDVDDIQSTTRAQQMARLETKIEIETELKTLVGEFVTQDAQIGAQLDGHAAGLGVSAVDYTTNGDGTAKYTPGHHDPILINEHGGQTPVAQDHRDKEGSTKDIVDSLKKVAVGGIKAGGGGLSIVAGVTAEAPSLGTSTIPIIAGTGSVADGAVDIYDGLDDLSRLTNAGRLPSAPPIIGQDGPG